MYNVLTVMLVPLAVFSIFSLRGSILRLLLAAELLVCAVINEGLGIAVSSDDAQGYAIAFLGLTLGAAESSVALGLILNISGVSGSTRLPANSRLSK